MVSNKKTARTAGVLYLLMIVTYMFSLGYVPGRFLITDDPAATIAAIRAAEWMFRLGIVVGMLACVVYALQVLALYRLLNPVSATAAAVFLLLSLAHLPLFFAGHVDELSLLLLLNESRGALFSSEQLHAQVALLTDSYRATVRLNMLFMALWLLPFGYLVFRSGILPRILGVLLVVNAIPYLSSFFMEILAPAYELPAIVNYMTAPMLVGEFATCLWLLIMGAKESAPGTAHEALLSGPNALRART
jgi:hypothetical protein